MRSHIQSGTDTRAQTHSVTLSCRRRLPLASYNHNIFTLWRARNPPGLDSDLRGRRTALQFHGDLLPRRSMKISICTALTSEQGLFFSPQNDFFRADFTSRRFPYPVLKHLLKVNGQTSGWAECVKTLLTLLSPKFVSVKFSVRSNPLLFPRISVRQTNLH